MHYIIVDHLDNNNKLYKQHQFRPRFHAQRPCFALAALYVGYNISMMNFIATILLQNVRQGQKWKRKWQ